MRLVSFLILWVGVCIAPLASAHQQKAAITKVLFNDRTGNIEVMHRFYIHDAEHAAGKILGAQVDLSSDKSAQLGFANYTLAHFQLGFDSPEPVELTTVGQEVDGKFLWIYQEIAIPAAVSELWFRFDALQSVWPSQINQINLEGRGPVRSLRFDRNDSWQSLVLPKPAQ